jgi:protein-tyrosine phosphatase
MPKTSRSHPLRIDSVCVPSGGAIGMTICPGKIQVGGLCGDWQRDLDTDLSSILLWGAKGLVTLMEKSELLLYRVADLPNRVPPGIRYFHLPIVDQAIPDAAWEERWQAVSPELHALLSGGERLVIHCRGGLGRTGTVAARLLVECGMDTEEAIKAVRRSRPGAIENGAQEGYVRRCGEVVAVHAP